MQTLSEARMYWECSSFADRAESSSVAGKPKEQA